MRPGPPQPFVSVGGDPFLDKLLFELGRHGVRRIVYASSIHTVGFYPTTERIDAEAPLRPDSYYGVSKIFGESLARLYVDKAGLELMLDGLERATSAVKMAIEEASRE